MDSDEEGMRDRHAGHLRSVHARSVATFQAAGIRLVPAATDVGVVAGASPAVFDWVPSAAALQLTTAALHEIAGLAYNRLRGWAL